MLTRTDRSWMQEIKEDSKESKDYGDTIEMLEMIITRKEVT